MFWSWVLGKYTLRLCFVPLVLICRMHWSIFVESSRFFCILLLRLYVLRCNIEIEGFVLRFQLSDFSAPPPGSLGPSTLWGLWLWHNIIIFLVFYEVFSDYTHTIIQLVLFLIAYDCSFHKLVVSRGMVSPAVI